MAAERVVLDTNVLVAAADIGRRLFEEASRLVEGDTRALAITDQVAREFMSVATRPTELNGLGLDGGDATALLDELTLDIDVLVGTADSLDNLMHLVRTRDVVGKQIHDASLVATALSHGAIAIVTGDRGLLARYADLIRIEPLA